MKLVICVSMVTSKACLGLFKEVLARGMTMDYGLFLVQSGPIGAWGGVMNKGSVYLVRVNIVAHFPCFSFHSLVFQLTSAFKMFKTK